LLKVRNSLNQTNPSNSWQAASDADLLGAAAQQNQQAFAELMARYYDLIFRVAWRQCAGRVDAEDVTQEAFLKLWRNPSQIREAAALKGWLIRVATNLVMDRYRQKPMQDLETAIEIEDGSMPAPQAYDNAKISKRVDEAIAQLPERQKLALTLVHFEHMTNIAAAAAMELSVDAIESLLARARRGLKQILAQDGRAMLCALQETGV
jgi:RNA polymerase sigma-70 factor (ECF subfamily)